MFDWPAFWHGASLVTHTLAGLAALAAAGAIGRRRERFGPAAHPLVSALAASTAWCLAVIAFGQGTVPAQIAEIVRNIAWLFAIYSLFASDGRHLSVAPIRPVLTVLALIEAIHLLFQVLSPWLAIAGGDMRNLDSVLSLLGAVGGLLLVHNLYLGASPQSRAVLRWPASALAIVLSFDLNFYTISYLSGAMPVEIDALRGLPLMASAGLLAFSALRGPAELRLRPSRAVAFQTVSLIVIGSYFLVMFGLAQWLAYAGGDVAKLVEVGILVGGSALALFVLPSRRLRGWLRVMVAKHLFQHRYDYRSEWLRFTHTIGNAADTAVPLQERVVKAVADIAESSAGLLLEPDESGQLVFAASWLWPTAEVPPVAMPAAATAFFERHAFIVDLDDLRAGRDERGETAVVPDWLVAETRAWAMVPLIHYARLVGVVVLARPPHARRFDWEDFDLLRVVGQQLASYLAEHAGQQALAEANRFEDFNRRIAFVMHDIKNLASQLSLLTRNAERHAENPAFRDDMLVTLRNSADKLNTLLARLSRYGGGGVERLAPVDGAAVARAVVGRFKGQHPVILADVQDCAVTANRESLEQVLVHLVQNAIDASGPESPVFLAFTSDGLHGRFEVVDSGCGMSPDFVRSRLFKPFVSSKPGGFGIGAFEARELVQAMKGRLEVESREGLGSRFLIRLPLVAASGLIEAFSNSEQKVA